MTYRDFLFTSVFLVTLSTPLSNTQAHDESKYPNWKGQWRVILTPGVGGQNVKFDPTKAWGKAQGAPLTPEYQKVHEDSMADQASGGLGNYPTARCFPGGMPRMMMAYEPMEVIVLPDTTYIHITFNSEFRRIYTDGRDWPKNEEPSFSGYSIGKWVDEDGDGRYDVLEVETRNLKGPRIFDPTGIPLHKDNQTVVKERIYLDKADPNILRDEITTIDNALTRPWTVTRGYRRGARNAPWVEHSCSENNDYVFIEGQTYHLGIDGKLAPSRKDQPPPDLRHFEQSRR
jgi:hypothetical protein